ncbi:unnamed protein product [Timema podura]|uniref:Uncharacterized protein n=1 Tax=Timema podura TaxID=61482 RepID=A0ABN7NP51_TIMPD|nr:unnamed protein product [Timema podura]
MRIKGIGKVEYIGSDPTFVWRESGKPFRENPPERDSHLDLPVLGSLAQHETSALDNYITETCLDKWSGNRNK